MSWDRRQTEAEIGALLHAYLTPRHIGHPPGINCHRCIGMAATLIEDAHKILDEEDFAEPWWTRVRLWTGETIARLAGHR